MFLNVGCNGFRGAVFHGSNPIKGVDFDVALVGKDAVGIVLFEPLVFVASASDGQPTPFAVHLLQPVVAFLHFFCMQAVGEVLKIRLVVVQRFVVFQYQVSCVFIVFLLLSGVEVVQSSCNS